MTTKPMSKKPAAVKKKLNHKQGLLVLMQTWRPSSLDGKKSTGGSNLKYFVQISNAFQFYFLIDFLIWFVLRILPY
jgi:hypothetical protein